MSLLSACLRLLIVTALAVGLGLPAQAATGMSGMTMPAQAMTAHMPAADPACPHDGADHPAPAKMPPDMACVQHCLGLGLPVPPATAALPARRTAPVWALSVAESAPSRAPQPERHPPRA
uniref:hypothetical protein n=1 Tax=Paenirhodobacter enshiensis TaxID=1105367 RepID=UPI0035B04EB8